MSGRNELCWCGSGREFGDCHLGREAQAPLAPGAISNSWRKSLNSKGPCLHPDAGTSCSGKIVRAHSVSKRFLRTLAEDGHVLWPRISWLEDGTPGARVERLGLARASTFSGFCGVHDKELFAPFEDSPFAGTPHQCFRMAYRAVCMELYWKRGSLSAMRHLKESDRGLPLSDQRAFQASLGSWESGFRKSLGEFENAKRRYDAVLESRDYSDLRFHIVDLGGEPHMACSAAIYPDCGFGGEVLWDDAPDVVPDLMTIHCFGTGGRGYFAFVWNGEAHARCSRLVDSFQALPAPAHPEALIRLILGFCENVYVRESWWNTLDDELRVSFTRLLLRGTPAVPRTSHGLLNDGLGYGALGPFGGV